MKNYLIIHVPHASAQIPDGTAFLISPEAEVALVTDWMTDDLFAGREQIMFAFSRLFCDVERFIPDELDLRGQGFFYTRTLDGRALREPSTDAVMEARRHYDEHHARLTQSVSRSVSLMPVVIIDAHSFSDRQAELSGYEGPIPDICLGFDLGWINTGLIDDLCLHFEDAGFGVALNQPYAGSIMPVAFKGNPDVRSLMIEVNKRLYLENGSNFPSASYEHVRKTLSEAMALIENFDFSGS